MKKIATLCIAASLALSATTSAHADWGRHYGDFRPPMHHHYRGGSGWVGPAAVLAIAGMAIGAAAYSNAYAAPAPVYAAPAYVPPPVYSAPPARGDIWYYCGSSGQYYPYTNACPEGWQAVPAR